MKVRRLSDPGDPRLADYLDVKDARWLEEKHVFLAEGRVVVRILLASERFRTRSVLVTEAALADVADALPEDTLVYLVPRSVMDRVSGVRFHQGCVAAAEFPAEPSIDACLARMRGGRRLAVVLEGVSDPDNVGATFRNALAFGLDAVLLSPGCAPPLYRKAVRTSMGASLRIPHGTMTDWPRDLERLRREGFVLLGLTPDAALDLEEYVAGGLPPDRLALVLGNEGVGLSRAVRAGLDREVRIAMARDADSLNVATAGAIAMQRLWSRDPGLDAV